MGDKELENICRDIYFKHRKAIDLIIQYKPDVFSDIAASLQEKLRSYPDIKLDSSNKTYIRFTTTEIDNTIESKGTWTGSGRLLLFEIQNRNGKVMMKAIIGPGDYNIRQKIFNIIGIAPKTFNGAAKKLGPQYTQIFSKEMASSIDIENAESNEIVVEKALIELEKFISNELQEIEKIVIANY